MTIAMILLASVLGAIVSQAGLGSSPAFLVPDYRVRAWHPRRSSIVRHACSLVPPFVLSIVLQLESLAELPLFIVFGGLCGVVSSAFLFSLGLATDRMQSLSSSSSMGENDTVRWLLPVAGGVTTGICALFFPEVLYEGFDNVNSVLSAPSGDYSATVLLQIVALKIVATSVSRGSGLRGGLYAPSIFIGAALGSAFGLTVHEVFDSMSMGLGTGVSAPQAYALVGVGAFLASACDIPLTAILLLFELTRDYLIIVPTLGAVGISYWISSNFLSWMRRRNSSGQTVLRSPKNAPSPPVTETGTGADADAGTGADSTSQPLSVAEARRLLAGAADDDVVASRQERQVTILVRTTKRR